MGATTTVKGDVRCNVCRGRRSSSIVRSHASPTSVVSSPASPTPWGCLVKRQVDDEDGFFDFFRERVSQFFRKTVVESI